MEKKMGIAGLILASISLFLYVIIILLYLLFIIIIMIIVDNYY